MNSNRSIGTYIEIILLCTIFLSGTLSAQKELRSNTELLHQVIEKSINQLTGVVPNYAHVIVTVQFRDYEWFIRHRVVNVLTASGFSVAGNSDDKSGDYYTLELGVERFGVNYGNAKRRSLFGSRMITRQADGVFSVRIIGGNTERVVRISESVSDIIPYSKRNEVENRALPFTQAEVPDDSFIERYLGPAIIIAATGIVVYLFFSVRS